MTEATTTLTRAGTEEVRRRTEELQLAQEVTMVAMASLAETRDKETGNHIIRTQTYVRGLAVHLRGHERFRDAFDSSSTLRKHYLLRVNRLAIARHALALRIARGNRQVELAQSLTTSCAGTDRIVGGMATPTA